MNLTAEGGPQSPKGTPTAKGGLRMPKQKYQFYMYIGVGMCKSLNFFNTTNNFLESSEFAGNSYFSQNDNKSEVPGEVPL